MFRDECWPPLLSALPIKLVTDPLDLRKINRPLGDNKLNVYQIVRTTVLRGGFLSGIDHIPLNIFKFILCDEAFGNGCVCRLFKSFRHHATYARTNRIRHTLTRDAVLVGRNISFREQ